MGLSLYIEVKGNAKAECYVEFLDTRLLRFSRNLVAKISRCNKVMTQDLLHLSQNSGFTHLVLRLFYGCARCRVCS